MPPSHSTPSGVPAPFTQAPSSSTSPTAVALLRVWLALSAQSFGGGAATQYLIYRSFVEQRSWVSPQQFARYWGICQIAPGINLLALTILIGWHLHGSIGVLVSLLGLLAPSVSITVLMTALYTGVRDTPMVQAALRGVVPATVGLGLLMSWQLVLPLLTLSRQKGKAPLLLSITILLASAGALAVLQTPVVLVLLGAGIAASLEAQRRSRLNAA